MAAMRVGSRAEQWAHDGLADSTVEPMVVLRAEKRVVLWAHGGWVDSTAG